MSVEVPFRCIGHTVEVPVSLVPGETTPFVLDTGIGLELVRPEPARRGGAKPSIETFSGHRMSGQEVRGRMVTLPRLEFGGVDRSEVDAGLLEMDLPPAFERIGGFLSLRHFLSTPFTIDFPRERVVVGSDRSEASGAGRARVPLRLLREGPALSVFLPMMLPTGTIATMEIDSGSDALILHRRFLGELGLGPEDPRVRRVAGTDETGHPFERFFARVNGAVRVRDAPTILQESPEVMFQEIIYDGLVGAEFLRRYAVGFDLRTPSITFSPPDLRSPPT